LNEVKSGGGLEIRNVVPGFRFAYPGYELSDPILMKPGTTAGFI
jgi:hypothetical protein